MSDSRDLADVGGPGDDCFGEFGEASVVVRENALKRPTAPPKRPDRGTEEWIDQTMAEGDIANGEGDPEGPRPDDPVR